MANQQRYWKFETFGTDPDQIGFFGDAGIIIPSGSTAQRPSSPTEGHIRLNTDANVFEGYISGSWQPIGTGGGGSSTFLGLTDTPASYASAANQVMRINSGETGVEFTDALTIENSGRLTAGTASYETLVTTNQTIPNKKYVDDQDVLRLALSGGLMTGTITMGGNPIVGLPLIPTTASEAASKQYVDSISAGFDFKESVHTATATGVNYSNTYNNGASGFGATMTGSPAGVLPFIDGHAHVNTGTRFLIKDQTNQIENGIYVLTDPGSGENLTFATTTADVAGSLDGTYWTFDDASTSYYVWYDTPGGSGDPAPGGTGIQVILALNDTAQQVAAATRDAINSSLALVTAGVGADLVTVHVIDDTTGTRTAATAGTSGFTVSTPLPGTASPTSWILTRSDDADNSPSNEVSGGMFVFVEHGETNKSTAWVLTSPTGDATLGTDNLVFTQFNPASGLFLPLAGGTMTGSIVMGTPGIQIIGDTTVAAAPTYTFAGDVTTGLHQVSGAGAVDIVSGGSVNWTFAPAPGALLPAASLAHDIGTAGTKVRDIYTDHVLPNFNAAGDPSYSFEGDTDTGMFNGGGDNLAFATGGTERMHINSSGTVVLTAGAVGLAFTETGGGSDFIRLLAPSAIGSSFSLTLPTADGSAGDVLSTNGFGVLSFTTISTSGIVDADGDTKVEVEESADDDTLRVDLGDSIAGYGPLTDALVLNAAGMTLDLGNSSTTAGAPISISSGSSTGGGGAGGAFNLFTGSGNAAAAGGAFGVTAGAGGATGDGGDITLTGGAGGSTSGDGGDLNLIGGDAVGSGAGGNVNMVAGAGASPGGDITITAGASTGGDTGGSVTIDAGAGGATDGEGGAIAITAGDAGATNAAGGAVTVSGGSGTGTEAGGAAVLSAGAGGTSGDGGEVQIVAGNAGASDGDGGTISLTAGEAFGATTTGGSIELTAGSATIATSGSGGSVDIQAGTGSPGASGTGGSVNLIAGDGGGTLGAVVVQNAGSGNVGELRINDAQGTPNYIGFDTPASVTTSYTMTFPAALPGTSGVFEIDSAGTISFTTTPSIVATRIIDADGDTKVDVEEGADDDTVRMDIGGLTGYPSQPNAFILNSSQFSIQLPTANVATTAGGDISLTAGGGNSADGGAVNITAGAGGALGSGGDVTITSGGPGSGSTPGDINIIAEDSNSGEVGGEITLTAGSNAGGSAAGGPITLNAGAGDGAGVGGQLDFNAGTGGTTAAGGAVNIDAGAGGSTSGDGGDINLNAGDATGGGSGGDVNVNAGTGSSPGGAINLTAGGSTGTDPGGAVNITAGTGGTGSGGVGGAVVVTAGDAGAASADDGGIIELHPGVGDGAGDSGYVLINGTGFAGELRFNDVDDSAYVGIKATNATTASYTLSLPPAVAASTGQALTSDTSGNLSWTTISTSAIVDADGDTKVDVEESGDEDIIRFDAGETPAGYGAVADIMTLASSGWTVNLGTATSVAGAPVSITAGSGGGTDTGGGDIDIISGDTSAGGFLGAEAGDIRITTGSSAISSGKAGDIELTVGSSGAVGVGGAITLTAGSVGSAGGGDVTLIGGDGGSDGGDIVLTPGGGTADGVVLIDSASTGAAPELRLEDDTGGQYLGMKAAGTTTSYTITWPSAVAASAVSALTSDTSGNMSWTAISTSSISDADGDTLIQVEEGADDDTIRFDTGESPSGYTTQADIFVLNSAGWTVDMGSALSAPDVPGASISFTAGDTLAEGGAAGGDITLTAGNASPNGGIGGAVSITAGDSSGSTGGAVSITAGEGGSGSDGGAVTITTGNQDADNQAGGTLTLQTGGPVANGRSGDGGSIVITTAPGNLGSTNPADGGDITITTGNAGASSGSGGDVTFTLGNGATGASGAGSDGGSFSVTAGNGGIESGTPGAINLTAGNATGTAPSAAGGVVNVTAGNGTGSNNGGAINITAGEAGPGGGAGVGGLIAITAGRATGSGNGGAVEIYAGSTDGGGTGGGVVIQAGASQGSGSGGSVNIAAADGGANGGDVQINAGVTQIGGNQGGLVTISAAKGGPTGAGGVLTLNGGDGGATSGDGGDVTINGGDADGSGAGGDINLNAGTGASPGGSINITAGDSTGADQGGDVAITAGTGGTGAGVGGHLVFTAGDAGTTSAAAGGDIELRPGAGDGAGADGIVQVIGPSAGSSGTVQLGDSGSNSVSLTAPSTVTASYTLTLPTAVASTAGVALVSDTSGNLSYSTVVPGTVQKFAQDNTLTSASEQFTHSLGTTDVVVQVYDLTASPTKQFIPGMIEIDDANNVTVTLAVAPSASGEYRVVITG